MSEEPTLPVELTLNESGILCHMLLRGIMDMRQAANKSESALLTPAVQRGVIKKMEHLYEKLATANDKLMGE